MSDTEQRPDSSICWQCGAPAEPACEYVQLLNSRPRQHPEAFGQKVKRGRWQDAAWVHVPRCASCQARNWIVAGLVFAAFFAGAMVGGFDYPSNGWTTIVGAFGFAIPVILGGKAYGQWRGYKNLTDFPPLRRLLAAGWSTPN